MSKFIKKLEKSVEVDKFTNIDIFSDKNLEIYNNPHYEISFNNDNIEYTYTDTIQKQEGGNEIMARIHELIKEIKRKMDSVGKVLYVKSVYKRDYKDIVLKKDLMYIKEKFGITFTESIYVYSDVQSDNIFGDMEYKFLTFYLNKKIEISDDFYLLYFRIPAAFYEKNIDHIIRYIIKVINKLNNNGSIVMNIIYGLIEPRLFNLYILFTHCFETVNIVYSKWYTSNKNIVFFVLKNKKRNIDEPKKGINNILIKSDTTKIRNEMLEFFVKILEFMNNDINVNKTLLKIKHENYKLYLSLSNKILEKMTIFYN